MTNFKTTTDRFGNKKVRPTAKRFSTLFASIDQDEDGFYVDSNFDNVWETEEIAIRVAKSIIQTDIDNLLD